MQAVTRVVMLTAGLALGAVAVIIGQDPPQQPPLAIRLAVDRVPVDVSVIGDDGRPVTGLAADRLHARRRRALAPHRVGGVRVVGSRCGHRLRHPSPTFSSNAGGGGRLIMFVVDRGNIAPGRGRQAMEAASRFLARLTPADRVGLIAFPGAGPIIDFTSNHAVVQSALPGLTGLTDTFPTSYRIATARPWRSSRAIARPSTPSSSASAPRHRAPKSATSACASRHRFATASSAASTNAHRRRSRRCDSSSIACRRRTTPKTIVYISEGLVLERPGDGAWLGPAAARGQVTIYALQLESSGRTRRRPGEPVAPGATRRSRTKGSTSSPARRAARCSRSSATPTTRSSVSRSSCPATTSSSFEPESGDRDGKPHKIKVARARPLRASTSAPAASSPSTRRASKTDDAILKETLQAPMLASEIGLKLATYTLRDPASDKLRILMAAEIDRSGNPDGRSGARLQPGGRQGAADRQPDRSRGQDAGLARDAIAELHRVHPQRCDRHAHAQDRRRRRARPARQRRAFVQRRA